MAQPNPEYRGLSPLTTMLLVSFGLVAAWGVYRELNRPKKATSTAAATGVDPTAATTSEQSVGTLDFKLEGPQAVAINANGMEAKVRIDPGTRLLWTIQNGNLEGPTDRDVVTFAPKGIEDVVLTCQATSEDGRKGTAILRVKVLPVPQISRFDATPSTITSGQKVLLTWSGQDLEKATLDPGGLDVTKPDPAGFAVQPTETTTYVLRATNRTGATASREVTVKVLPAPSGISLKATPSTPDTWTVEATFAGGKAVLTMNGVVIGTGASSPLQVQVDRPAPGAVVELTVTNDAGANAKTQFSFPSK